MNTGIIIFIKYYYEFFFKCLYSVKLCAGSKDVLATVVGIGASSVKTQEFYPRRNAGIFYFSQKKSLQILNSYLQSETPN